MTVVAGAIVAAAIVWVGRALVAELSVQRSDAQQDRALTLIQTFAPGIAAAAVDPRAFLVWQPLARTARSVFPREFSILDDAAGSVFPFAPTQIEAAHAQWTAEWLAWERSHDADFKTRAADAERDPASQASPDALRSRLDAIEREKLELYQRRYEEYIKVARSLQTLAGS